MGKGKSNLTAKIFSLIIAIILWSYVMGIEDPEQEWEIKNMTVSLTNISALDKQGLVVMEPSEVTVNVKLTGKRSDREKFIQKNILSQVDLSGYNEGQVKVPVYVRLADQSTSVRLVSWEPKEILFNFEKIVERDRTVTIKTSGNLAENYVIGDIGTKSQSITIKGPRSWVNEVAEVVAYVDLEGRNASDNVPVPIKLLDDEGNDVRGVEKYPSTIDVSIPIFRTKTLPIELITQGELPQNYAITEISINPSSIAIKGSNDIESLTKIDTKPIDINNLLDRTFVEVELDLPENILLLNPNDKVIITYKIEEIIEKDLSYTLEGIDILNLNESLIINSDDFSQNIGVTIKGIKSILDEVDKSTYKPSIDLLGLDEGRHEVKINIPDIQGVSVERISPEPLIINIKKR